jgi:DNA-binding cell septation regulator SpoVG
MEGSMADIEIKIRSWVRGSDEDQRAGLLGYLSAYYGSLVIDGITVRRTTEGRITLSYPERRDGKGRRHSIVRPVDDSARREIERVVLGQATLVNEVRP